MEKLYSFLLEIENNNQSPIWATCETNLENSKGKQRFGMTKNYYKETCKASFWLRV